MKFAFKDFLFDSKELKLYKDDRKLNLKQKPAQILELFLSAPQTIHSKEDILEKVWPDRKVTDQVVFQNIGHLRALFGDDAIRTFSRKGYQWQIPCTAFEGTAEAQASSQASPQTATNESTKVDVQPVEEETVVTESPSEVLERPGSSGSKLPMFGLAGVLVLLALGIYFTLS
ncbi:transcriptional regulator [Pseudoalteromonas piscicida]|uniref:Transcriptional regulator n=1 Tax=Pseudoalteromonas piscicida TaxID=43662 RepID=A0AAQ2EPL3_PSEO7|nr:MULTISPECIES: winged helix-turn-helix domain-containing protein [Pseudoalteromonas]KJY83810.1 transcriptional regulator [Pseudoalteromonas piscicida]TMN35368.1 transcriptional regulator [Pseudoalteromonas piscicida]TMN38036.1 transcriptional regulator [Pseudoalteromonas piscicida]TMN47899.1 transcriptional regulator [Pseudoalteromonas piscicida]TMN50373.1 transcriptional regulator [Pseudoalteromonas piscicida]